jgi:hypothetical protein
MNSLLAMGLSYFPASRSEKGSRPELAPTRLRALFFTGFGIGFYCRTADSDQKPEHKITRIMQDNLVKKTAGGQPNVFI